MGIMGLHHGFLLDPGRNIVSKQASHTASEKSPEPKRVSPESGAQKIGDDGMGSFCYTISWFYRGFYAQKSK
jgi:hypothetical protein